MAWIKVFMLDNCKIRTGKKKKKTGAELLKNLTAKLASLKFSLMAKRNPHNLGKQRY